MFKSLLKKQFMELNSAFFMNKKDGKRKKRSAMIRSIILFIVLMVFVGFMMYLMTGMISGALLGGIFGVADWFYFAIMSVMTILLGVVGSVFNTMSALYKAKDNELLLSMPIPPMKILIVRMIAVYAMSLLYSALVWIPTMIRYWNSRHPGALSIVFCILLTFLIALLVTVLACVAGWIVAMISVKLKNRSIVTVIISLIFFGIYYFICFRLNSILTTIVTQSEAIGAAIKARVYPIYALGNAAAGDAFSMLTFTLITAGLFGICCLVLSRSFIRIITTNRGMKKAVYKEQQAKEKNNSQALFGRELLHFSKSATYMLNCGLGLIILPAVGILLLVYQRYVDQVIDMIFGNAPDLLGLVPVIFCAFICLTASMNAISAPSVSLEGHSVWIAQSLPVPTMDILRAKLKLHIVINLPSVIISTVLIGTAIHADPPIMILMILTGVLYTCFAACFGLKLNLKNPNLNWNNESIPIKQSMPIAISLFGGWGICSAAGVLYFILVLLVYPVPAWAWLLICCAALVLVTMLLGRWLRKKGTALFEEL